MKRQEIVVGMNLISPPVNKEKAYDIIDVMIKMGKSHNVSAARIALAWMLRKPGITSIIIGAKRKEQLLDNIAATELVLSEKEIQELDTVSDLSPEYPGWMIERQQAGRWPE
jgi:aryl-alcohol dehydrogenase-like predicted oxidoreductase